MGVMFSSLILMIHVWGIDYGKCNWPKSVWGMVVWRGTVNSVTVVMSIDSNSKFQGLYAVMEWCKEHVINTLACWKFPTVALLKEFSLHPWILMETSPTVCMCITTIFKCWCRIEMRIWVIISSLALLLFSNCSKRKSYLCCISMSNYHTSCIYE